MLKIFARRPVLVITVASLLLVMSAAVQAQEDRPFIRFGVGPLQPTPAGTQAAFEPFFAYLAEQLDVDYELTATDSWAGISVAMISEQVDIAWMGPWGYVLANDASEVLTDNPITAIATVKYDEQPIYHAIIVGRPEVELPMLDMGTAPSEEAVNEWLETAAQYSISFADLGSTSGYLIPTAFFQTYAIDPEDHFARYSEGSTHAANETAVVNGQVDLATDFDRNRNTMISNGAFTEEESIIYWRSAPLPNDAIAVRAGLDPELVENLQSILLNITPELAQELEIGIAGSDNTQVRYTGFVEATDSSYASIRSAGIFIGEVGARTRDMEPAAEETN
ncbi:MAG: phosphate/phosphite/phosphonate ABC transporter substrate-binding protein [Chloroflexi bacterium]|nr:phosphate/phosphite/phosphonate ABC transporter substrate-binding protein [Chloroflexota bacterium]